MENSAHLQCKDQVVPGISNSLDYIAAVPLKTCTVNIKRRCVVIVSIGKITTRLGEHRVAT